jgi:hypothetical protein
MVKWFWIGAAALFVALVWLAGCTTSEEPTPWPEQAQPPTPVPMAMAVVVSSCRSLEAINNIVEADQVSDLDAVQVFNRYQQDGTCGVYRTPRPMMLAKFQRRYVDSQGRESEIWQIFGTDHWALILSENVIKGGKRQPKRQGA